MKRMRLFMIAVSLLALGVGGIAQQEGSSGLSRNSQDSARSLQQARQLILYGREGHFDVAPKAVAILEDALATDAQNPAIHAMLALAYNFQAVASMQPGGNPADGAKAGQQAFAAVQRALRIDPNNAEALALHGGMLAQAAQRPEVAKLGRNEIYKAVELAPSAPSPRLVRAALGLNSPAAERDTAALIEDLKFLSAAGAGSRSGDIEHLMLGDLYAELGQADAARTEYAAAARRPGSPVKAQVQDRLTALAEGRFPTEEVTRLRSAIGDCVMCHGR
jgi:cytochrome c-type biogenesis protein CcmH/NrfG